jgi:hypothetical protein
VRIALASCSNLPAWEVDDKPFHAELARLGVEAPQVPWDAEGVDWGSFDAVLIRTTWDYQERRDAFVAWAERVAAVTRLFNPFGVVRWNTHKSYLRDLEARGVPVIPTAWLAAGSRADVGRILEERGWRRAFIKPAVGATARETLRFDAGRVGEAQRHVERLLPREDLLVQPYLARVETEGECSAIFIDGELTHGVRKVPVAGDYRVQDDFGAKDGPWAMSAAEGELARRVVEAAGAHPAKRRLDAQSRAQLLYARVDFLRDDEGALRVTELELVEPSLFFRHGRHAATKLAEGLVRRLRVA